MAPASTCLLAVLSGGPNIMPRTLEQSPLLAAGVVSVLGNPQGSRYGAMAPGWAVSRQWGGGENIYGSEASTAQLTNAVCDNQHQLLHVECVPNSKCLRGMIIYMQVSLKSTLHSVLPQHQWGQ